MLSITNSIIEIKLQQTQVLSLQTPPAAPFFSNIVKSKWSPSCLLRCIAWAIPPLYSKVQLAVVDFLVITT